MTISQTTERILC